MRGRVILGTSPVGSSQKFALRELSEVGISSAPGGAALSDGRASADTKMILVIRYTLHDKGKPVVRRGRKATDLSTKRRQPGSRTEGEEMYRAALDLAGRSLPMITIHVQKRYGPSTVRSCVTAPTIEQALLLAGGGARVVFPIDGEAFFASAKPNS